MLTSVRIALLVVSSTLLSCATSSPPPSEKLAPLALVAVDSEREPATYVGGSAPTQLLPGLVSFDDSGETGPCTGVFLSPKHILTAAHCLTQSSSALLEPKGRILSGPHFPMVTPVRILSDAVKGSQLAGNIQIVGARFLAEHVAAARKVTTPEKLEAALALGDMAILEINPPVSGLRRFPKILLSDAKRGDAVWVGGFGKQGPGGPTAQSQRQYRGSTAVLGARSGSFGVDLMNVGTEITYLAPGDSGGPVFKEVGGAFYVVGVNHATFGGFDAAYDKLAIDPKTRKLRKRAPGKGATQIGVAHYFIKGNRELQAWVAASLPAGTYEVR